MTLAHSPKRSPAPQPAHAASPCTITLYAPYDNDTVASHHARGDCPVSPMMDWVKGELYSLFFAWPTMQDNCINNTNTSNPAGCLSQYTCNGTGELEHFGKVNVRDTSGQETGWRETSHVWLDC